MCGKRSPIARRVLASQAQGFAVDRALEARLRELCERARRPSTGSSVAREPSASTTSSDISWSRSCRR